MSQLHQPLVLTVSCVDSICVAIFRSKGAEICCVLMPDCAVEGLDLAIMKHGRWRLCRCLARQSMALASRKRRDFLLLPGQAHNCSVLGPDEVVEGLDLAVMKHNEEETFEVSVAPEYGFGDHEQKRSLATVPANSQLHYTVEILDVQKVS